MRKKATMGTKGTQVVGNGGTRNAIIMAASVVIAITVIVTPIVNSHVSNAVADAITRCDANMERRVSSEMARHESHPHVGAVTSDQLALIIARLDRIENKVDGLTAKAR